MRLRALIVWMLVALMMAQQSLIAGHARRDESASAVLPHAGSVTTDARHNTRVLRVTDENDGRSADVVSSTSFNADATRFVVNLDGAATLYRFDAASLSILKEGPLFDREALNADSLQWSASEADTIFGFDATDGAIRLAAYDATERRSRVIKDFSAIIGRGEAGRLTKSASDDDRFAFAWREAGASAWQMLVVWNRVNDGVYTFDLNDPAAGVAGFTGASFNQSAEALIINGVTTRAWRFATTPPSEAVQIAPASDVKATSQSIEQDVFSIAADAASALPPTSHSRDGRFALFSANATGARRDAFIAAVSPLAASTIVWTNLVNSSARDNSVQKTAGSNDADDASATSLQNIVSGDGYVEFTAIDTDKERVCGLSNSNVIHSSVDDINFAVKLNSARKAFVVENGVVKAKVKYKPNNVFRVALESNVVHYYKNGELIYTSEARPAYPMLVTASLVSAMSSIDRSIVYGASTPGVVSISPASATLNASQAMQFKALITSATLMGLSWSADGGTITSNGLYTAPATSGTYTIRATLVDDTPITATATVTVGIGGDKTPPVISAVASSGVTASAANITWTTNEASDSTVDYGTTTAYGASVTNATRVISHTLALSGLVASTTYHFRVKSRDAAGNLATSGDYTFATSAASGGGGGGGTAPVISVLSTGSVTTSGATVTWTTDKTCDTQVEYGASASYGSSTALNSTRATTHSATLSGLVANTTYHFRVRSRDAAGNLVMSGDQTFMTASSGSGGGGGGGGGGGVDPLKTDKNVYSEPAPPALPAAGGTLVDPVFGTTIMRVTDERDGGSNTNSYSYWPSLNRNSTRLMVFTNNGNPTLYAFDPVNFRISNKRSLFMTSLPTGGLPWTEDVIWSGTDPDVMYCHSGLKIYAYNVVSNSYTLVKDFAGLVPGEHLFQMAKSVDDNAFGFTLKDGNWNIVGCVGWQRAQNNLYVMQSSTLDEVEVDKSGQYLYVMTGDQSSASAINGQVVNLQTRQVTSLTDGTPDFAPGHKDCGQGIVIGSDHWNNALNTRSLANPHQHSVVISWGNDWSQSNHVSLLGDGDGWLLVSMFVANTLPSTGLFKNELYLVATDGSQRVRRLAHHHSVLRDYWDSPRADLSRDGQFAIFTSNWGSTSRRDVFIVKIPPPGGGGGDTTPPVLSAIAGANVTSAGATLNWATDEASDTQVDYGTTASYGSSTALNSTRATTHSATLSGLVANTTYHFRVRSRDAAGNLAMSADMVLTPPGGTSGGGGGGGGGASQNVVWTGMVNCTASGNGLQKTSGRDDTPDAGARSQQSLVSGDGYLQFTAQETNKLRFCGLTRNPAVPDFLGIDYMIKLNDFAIAEVREANVYKWEVPYTTGDVFRIAVEGGGVKYYKNGTAFYTSTRAVGYPLTTAASFIALSGTITNAVMAATTGTLAMNDTPLMTRATLLAATVALRDAGSPLAINDSRSEGVNVSVREAMPIQMAHAIASFVATDGERRGIAVWLRAATIT
ncbi:MAG: fibronectin type III domain-containing protein [Blastocatellia bacterium]